METDASYWRRRSRELLDAMEADEASMIQRLAGAYKSEAAKLARDIRAYYAEYGQDDVIEYRRLLASCSEADRRLLIEDMEKFGRKYPKWAHLLPVRASIYKLDAMEAIQMQIYLQELKIGAIEQDEFEHHLQEQALRAANLAAEQMGYGASFYTLDSGIVQACVGLAWSAGENYSERIWANRQKLTAYLSDDFAKAVARGVAYDKIARDMAERFEDVSVRNAKRLVFTEGTFIFNEAQARVHEQRFDAYTVETVRDGKVCEDCKGIQDVSKDDPIPFSDRSPGINFPPLHPWCRCVYQVAAPDWDAWIDEYVAERERGER